MVHVIRGEHLIRYVHVPGTKELLDDPANGGFVPLGQLVYPDSSAYKISTPRENGSNAPANGAPPTRNAAWRASSSDPKIP